MFEPVAVPFSVVTTTLTVVAAPWAGVSAMIDVLFSTEKLVAAVPSKVTELAPTKFVPVMLTPLPPVVLPAAGVTLATAVGAPYVNTFVPVAVPFNVVTTTFTVPAPWTGVTAIIDVLFSTE